MEGVWLSPACCCVSPSGVDRAVGGGGRRIRSHPGGEGHVSHAADGTDPRPVHHRPGWDAGERREHRWWWRRKRKRGRWRGGQDSLCWAQWKRGWEKRGCPSDQCWGTSVTALTADGCCSLNLLLCLFAMLFSLWENIYVCSSFSSRSFI